MDILDADQRSHIEFCATHLSTWTIFSNVQEYLY